MYICRKHIEGTKSNILGATQLASVHVCTCTFVYHYSVSRATLSLTIESSVSSSPCHTVVNSTQYYNVYGAIPCACMVRVYTLLYMYMRVYAVQQLKRLLLHCTELYSVAPDLSLAPNYHSQLNQILTPLVKCARCLLRIL